MVCNMTDVASKNAVLICRTKQDKCSNCPGFKLRSNCVEVCTKVNVKASSARQIFVSAGVCTFKALLKNVMFKFMLRLDESEKSIIMAKGTLAEMPVLRFLFLSI